MQAVRARLDALENDNEGGDTPAAESEDDEFLAESEDEGACRAGWCVCGGGGAGRVVMVSQAC